MLLIIIFMYIFNFSIIKQIPIITSSILIGLILFIKFIINNNYRMIVLSTIKSKKVSKLFIILTVVQIYSICITILHNIYDFNIVETFTNQYINLIIGIFIYGLFKIKGKSENIEDYIIYAFIAQSVIQFTSIISPTINEIFNIFRPQLSIDISQSRYNGIRGLAISGTNFFGLACGYGLIYILYFNRWKYLFNNSIVIKIISLLLLVFGGLSSGRSSFIGLIISIFYFILNKKHTRKIRLNIFNIKFKNRNILISLLISIFLIFAGSTVINKGISDDLMAKLNSFNRFAFAMFYNLENGKGFTTSSSSRMFNEMYFKVSPKTFVLGDGAYQNEDGSYYKHTDVGYMRNILFFGVIGFILLTIYQINILLWDKNNRLISCIFIIYIFIMHLKGEVLGFLILTQNILMLYFLSKLNIKIERKNTEIHLRR